MSDDIWQYAILRFMSGGRIWWIVGGSEEQWPRSNIGELLDRAGADGWELGAVHQYRAGDEDFFFKRRKRY